MIQGEIQERVYSGCMPYLYERHCTRRKAVTCPEDFLLLHLGYELENVREMSLDRKTAVLDAMYRGFPRLIESLRFLESELQLELSGIEPFM
jgi:hypothetical protein